MRYKTSQAAAEGRIDALEPHDPYVRLLRLMFRLAEHLQVPLFSRASVHTRGAQWSLSRPAFSTTTVWPWFSSGTKVTRVLWDHN